ncbi:MAG: FHIPEP family type III secretion protein [Nitrospirae bacterium]|nr:FHIPEP family type III secretion protein [Nitrospirota bacterium]MBF0540169.1 FHIPEP family type III secretion protein [Nitrospirota bacterium]
MENNQKKLNKTNKIKQRLLIIAENENIHNIVKLILEDEHYIITSGYDIRDGLEMFIDETFDIILIDESQSISNGLSLCKELKNLKKISHIPIILMYSNSVDDSKLEDFEIDGTIKKPIEMDLIRKIKEVISVSNKGKDNNITQHLNTEEISDFIKKINQNKSSQNLSSQINKLITGTSKAITSNTECLSIKPYDLSLVRRIVRSLYPGFEYINNRFVNQFRNTLIDWTNKFIDINDCTTSNITCIDKMTLNKELPLPSTYFTFSMFPFNGDGIFVIEDKLVYALTYMFLSNHSKDFINECLTNRRDYNNIEQENLNKFVTLMMSDYGISWNHIIGLNPKPIICYRNPLFLFLDEGISNEYFLVRKMSLKFNESIPNFIEGNFYIAVPMLSVEPIINKLKSCSFEVINKWTVPVSDFINNTEAAVSVDLDINGVNIHSILNLQKGDILPLNRSTIDNLNVKVEGITKFKACCEKIESIVPNPFNKFKITTVIKLDEELEKHWYFETLKPEKIITRNRIELGSEIFSKLPIYNLNNSIELFSDKIGFKLPKFSIIENRQIEPNMYEIYLNDIIECRSNVFPNHLFVFNDQLKEKIKGISSKDPVFGGSGRWIDSGQFSDDLGKGINSLDMITRHIEEVIWCNIGEFFGFIHLNDINRYLENYHKPLNNEFRKLNCSDKFLKSLLIHLLKERIPIVDITKIIETIIDNNHLIRVGAFSRRVSDTDPSDELVEKIRKTLSRNIIKQYLRDDGTISVIKLNEESEKLQKSDILNQIEAIYKSDRYRREPIILYCDHLVRIKIKNLIKNNDMPIIILADYEIPNSVRIKYKGIL